MFASFITLLILFFIIKYILAWIDYFNKLDDRLGDSLWRWSYDYHVIGERDISDLDDKDFVRLRRKRNKVVTYMYIVFFIMFFPYFLYWNILINPYTSQGFFSIIILIKNLIYHKFVLFSEFKYIF